MVFLTDASIACIFFLLAFSFGGYMSSCNPLYIFLSNTNYPVRKKKKKKALRVSTTFGKQGMKPFSKTNMLLFSLLSLRFRMLSLSPWGKFLNPSNAISSGTPSACWESKKFQQNLLCSSPYWPLLACIFFIGCVFWGDPWALVIPFLFHSFWHL